MSSTPITEMLRNRVAKNAKHLGKWARRERVTCYRLYDRDIPEVPITVDTYEGALVIGDYRHVDAAGERGGGEPWLDEAAAAAGAAIGVAADHVFVKRRERLVGRRDGHQYERLGDHGARRTVHEAGHAFEVNLSDYLDTGLFLDHRLTRARAAAEPGDSLLNLFAYTGAFTVHAAAAGKRTTSVDLSKTYLEWAARNLALNALDGDPARHALVHADVREFLVGARAAGTRWDLAVVDPPTFSNSKRMDYTWDIQRDHAGLLADVAAVVRPGGVIWFSTNRRKFELDTRALADATVTDETAATSSPDFRGTKAHHAYRNTLA